MRFIFSNICSVLPDLTFYRTSAYYTSNGHTLFLTYTSNIFLSYSLYLFAFATYNCIRRNPLSQSPLLDLYTVYLLLYFMNSFNISSVYHVFFVSRSHFNFNHTWSSKVLVSLQTFLLLYNFFNKVPPLLPLCLKL